MNFYTQIKDIAILFDAEIKTFMYPYERAEVQSLNFSAFPVIIISNSINGSGTFEPNGNIKDAANYSIRFLTNDTRDNSDAENYTGITENSYQKSLDMFELGSSILNKFKNSNVFIEKPTFNYSLLYKITSNNLTGAEFNLSFAVAADKICI